MGKTVQVAADRAFDQTKTVLPAEVARGVYIRNAPSLQALKLMHLMIATAGGRMAEAVRHEIRLADIRAIDGMKNHDRESLSPLFEELRSVVIREGDPSDDEQRVTIGGLLDHAVLSRKDPASGDTILSWFFGRMFLEMAGQSNHWAILDRQTVFHLTSRYSVMLFQHISSLVNLDRMNSKTFTVPELRALLGVPEGKHQRFAELNRWCLQAAISEINQLSRLTLTATPKKVGRTVASVTISWEAKPDPTSAKRELASHSAGRKARREGTVETPVMTFPASGSIEFDEHWKQIKRAAGCNWDNTKIASDFRSYCRDKGIPLNARNIEKTFAGFCRAKGKI